MKSKLLTLAIGCLVVGNAYGLDIVLNSAFSNYTPPLIGDFGVVTLTESGDDVVFSADFTNSAAGPNVDLHYLFFNVNSADVPDISDLSIVGADVVSFNAEFDANKANGDGFYDVEVYFGSGGATKLQLTSFVVSSISGADLDIDFFADGTPATQEVDAKAEKGGPYTMAAHLQSTSLNEFDSEFVGGNIVPNNNVPEPGIISLLGFGLLALIRFRKRRI